MGRCHERNYECLGILQGAVCVAQVVYASMPTTANQHYSGCTWALTDAISTSCLTGSTICDVSAHLRELVSLMRDRINPSTVTKRPLVYILPTVDTFTAGTIRSSRSDLRHR